MRLLAASVLRTTTALMVRGSRGVSGGLHDATMPYVIDPATQLAIGPEMEARELVQVPEHKVLEGRYCRLEPLEARHAAELYACSSPADAEVRFRYLFDAPPRSVEEVESWIRRSTATPAYLYYAVVDKASGRVGGRQSLMRIDPTHRSIENGNVYMGPGVARSRVATEANYLFASYVFGLGYRRFEWKCDALNAKSRSAALRFGFTYEGHFRRAIINKGRSRDTSWFAMIDEEWPYLDEAYQTWLHPDNFHPDGSQKRRLSDLTKLALERARLGGSASSE
mmetsp:Transcript_1927/g.5824  ORF Transcript_1927/g.5824 Transcript_1927/m.5824 type:complete len:281 (-) Transcript_1927:97-939(-)